jgi:hypothetical protein
MSVDRVPVTQVPVVECGGEHRQPGFFRDFARTRRAQRLV